MIFYDKTASETLLQLKSDKKRGLNKTGVITNRKTYGENVITKNKKRTFLNRLFDAFKEPMLLILVFGFVLALGTNLGKYLKSREGDFAECFGILFAIILSVSITLIMEGSSEKAFNALGKIYENLAVRVIRDGETVLIPQGQVVVGDIIIIESGDKIVADGRLLESVSLAVDESTLTGESLPAKKDARVVLDKSVALAERINCVYSGTFVAAGNGLMVVTAVGNKTEIGNIAGELIEQTSNSPLQVKLGKLGKTVTIVGACCAVLVFILSVIRLYFWGTINFSSVQELFVSCIVLIIAAVPEGLPTIVAVSLALNMIKLAKENALIKKMTATETAGAVSVICSDKTGTLTENKMSVVSVCKSEYCIQPEKVKDELLWQNFVCNSTADITVEKKRVIRKGSSTECALIEAYKKSQPKINYKTYRESFVVVEREPFSSENKYMTTTIRLGNIKRKLIKGAPEKVLSLCKLTNAQISKILSNVSEHQKKARRVICFGHIDFDNADSVDKYVYDGYVAISDPIRKEVYKAVQDCRRAGIKVKILTGDNRDTALAIARELKLCEQDKCVVNAQELENLTDEQLKKILPNIAVIARSTPIIKLRVVKALKSLGEVVAVTGDGINDAPAIKQADVGIAMGEAGSEITKEAADIVLLDDSFSTVVKAVSFGRNVYKNLQRFIVFQLSVNVSALLFITVCAILGLTPPFNTLQLLWINIIMDGPPALTLGLERATDSLMNNKPIKKDLGIVGKKMLIKIIFNGVFVGGIMILQYLTDFMHVGEQMSGVIFTTFILFQLFNAFNSRELGSQSIFKGIGKNKLMLLTFGSVFLVHIFIVQVCAGVFGVSSLSLVSWIKCLVVSFSIVAVSEIYKAIFRAIKKAKYE
ncbi:MAG: calcium-translocating P-type ATPase, PMCA-type [Clostridia bacterium]|nr:calcium-translocating P-type ATPase, PMCA-type [Clostridia bacterium]